jgi:hypothetical protein
LDGRLDELPDELQEARNKLVEAIVKEEEAKSKCARRGLENGPELVRLCLEHALINQQWLSVERTEDNY